MNEAISVFDMLKIGVGPSSSHTLGPWRAASTFANRLVEEEKINLTDRIEIDLYGSLALTGHGHGTDVAILLGLEDCDPETIALSKVKELPQKIRQDSQINLAGQNKIGFDPDSGIRFNIDKSLDYHSNGMKFSAYDVEGEILLQEVFYSLGGGFILNETDIGKTVTNSHTLPFPIERASDLNAYCMQENKQIWEIVLENEKQWRTPQEITTEALRIWKVIQECIYRGAHGEGVLPGGLNVKRRAPGINKRLCNDADYSGFGEWCNAITGLQPDFPKILKWIGVFAMAVNEENADFGRVVTAPTNGAAGVVPAVLFYYWLFCGERKSDEEIVRFLMVAAEVGSIFKKGATISAAMGGCQAEIGVSSSMAAAALTEGLGGSVDQALMAAEIAMEHHLGLTCDPVAGLVQIPCIERNTMGAVKAITAAHIALESDPEKAKVTLDNIVKVMWETAQDMNSKYKETSQAGLAVQVPIRVSEC